MRHDGNERQVGIRALAKAGLSIQGHPGEPVDRYIIVKTAPETTEGSQDLETRRGSNHKVIDDSFSHLYRQGTAWVFEVWEYVPGPGESDFVVHFPSLEAAIDAILAFYFGQSSVIDDWIVPLHRHPELTVEGVCFAIADAVNVAQEAFEGLVERRGHRIQNQWQLTRWKRALQSQFLGMQHRVNPTIKLQLRRDMQEAYNVHLSDGERS